MQIQNIYTHENWLLFLKTYFPECKTQGECHAILGDILDLSPVTIATSIGKKKPLPTWAKAFIFSFIKSQNVTKDLVISECIERINFALNPMKSSLKTDLPPAVDL